MCQQKWSDLQYADEALIFFRHFIDLKARFLTELGFFIINCMLNPINNYNYLILFEFSLYNLIKFRMAPKGHQENLYFWNNQLSH